MPVFHYKAYDNAGQHQSGEIEALSSKGALDILHARGLVPFETTQATGVQKWNLLSSDNGTSKLPLEDWEEFTRELAVFLEAGLPLEQCIRLVADEARSVRIRKLGSKLHEKIIAGSDLSSAISVLAPTAPPIITSVVSAAESSGRLPEALKELAQFFTIELELKRKVTGALVYPAVLVITALVVVTIVASTLVPALMPMFEQSNAAPPPILSFISETTDNLKAHWQLALFLLITTVLLVRFALWTKRGQRAKARTVLMLPIIGDVVRSSNIAIYSRTLGTLLNNGLALTEALKLSAAVITNPILREATENAAIQVTEGKSLSEALRQEGGFTSLALRFVSVGESASQLDVMLLHLARVLESKTTRKLENAVTLLGPALTIFIGVLVGGLILTVMQAVLGVNDLALQ